MAAEAVCTGLECAEVHQLGAGGACEALGAGAAEAQSRDSCLGHAAAVVMARTGGARIHLLLTEAALVTWDRRAGGGEVEEEEEEEEEEKERQMEREGERDGGGMGK